MITKIRIKERTGRKHPCLSGSSLAWLPGTASPPLESRRTLLSPSDDGKARTRSHGQAQSQRQGAGRLALGQTPTGRWRGVGRASARHPGTPPFAAHPKTELLVKVTSNACASMSKANQPPTLFDRLGLNDTPVNIAPDDRDKDPAEHQRTKTLQTLRNGAKSCNAANTTA